MGLRKGAALALRWSDVDLDRKTLRVAGTLTRMEGGELIVTEPKTENSRRTIPAWDAAVELLKDQRKSQPEDRMATANLWTETGHVCTTETAAPLDPRNTLRALTRAATKINLERVNVHSLRHSAGYFMAEAGVPLKVISTIFGHADIRITADTYGHVTDDAAHRAMAALGSAFSLPVAPLIALGSALGQTDLGSKRGTPGFAPKVPLTRP